MSVTEATVTVATLVANPLTPCLSDALIKLAAQALPAHAEEKILDQGIAADLVFENSAATDHGLLAQTIREALGQAPVDVIVQPLRNRRKQLFLADMDSTMIGQECIDELADFVGLKAKVSDITERAMRGELDFEPALRERVALLKGLDLDVIEQILQSRISYTAGGRALVMTMKAHGAYTALVSGGFTLFTGPVSQHLGFDEHRSNRLSIHEGKLAGLVEDPVLGKEAKRTSLIGLRDARGLNPSLTMAVGDGANDLAMLGEAGLGVAFYAKPAVAAAAHARIDHADLTALLYAQGFRKADFVGL
ncbi:MAG: phosphoserine phosphatase SerB [Rhizobiales bacterium]|jgi:phosphoserine phosphatase|nr:phosphoserine phosphatase SerB [Hyphomicrobiales bacterium]